MVFPTYLIRLSENADRIPGSKFDTWHLTKLGGSRWLEYRIVAILFFMLSMTPCACRTQVPFDALDEIYILQRVPELEGRSIQYGSERFGDPCHPVHSPCYKCFMNEKYRWPVRLSLLFHDSPRR